MAEGWADAGWEVVGWAEVGWGLRARVEKGWAEGVVTEATGWAAPGWAEAGRVALCRAAVGAARPAEAAEPTRRT